MCHYTIVDYTTINDHKKPSTNILIWNQPLTSIIHQSKTTSLPTNNCKYNKIVACKSFIYQISSSLSYESKFILWSGKWYVWYNWYRTKIDTHAIQPIMSYISNKSWIVLTGEGSSRIFPAKMMRHQAMRHGYHQHIVTQWWLQLMEYDLSTYAVLACSNSGKTKEIISLLSNLQQQGHQACIWITAWQQTPLQQVTQYCHILQSWEEHACAATKTVIEQWLLYDMILWSVTWIQWDYQNLSTLMSQTLQYTISSDIVEIIAQASKLYFAGRNDGVAEELALKTYEIIKNQPNILSEHLQCMVSKKLWNPMK